MRPGFASGSGRAQHPNPIKSSENCSSLLRYYSEPLTLATDFCSEFFLRIAPRERPPVQSQWDGLERLLGA